MHFQDLQADDSRPSTSASSDTHWTLPMDISSVASTSSPYVYADQPACPSDMLESPLDHGHHWDYPITPDGTYSRYDPAIFSSPGDAHSRDLDGVLSDIDVTNMPPPDQYTYAHDINLSSCGGYNKGKGLGYGLPFEPAYSFDYGVGQIPSIPECFGPAEPCFQPPYTPVPEFVSWPQDFATAFDAPNWPLHNQPPTSLGGNFVLTNEQEKSLLPLYQPKPSRLPQHWSKILHHLEAEVTSSHSEQDGDSQSSSFTSMAQLLPPYMR